jgi:predicted nucleic acid-binding protein
MVLFDSSAWLVHLFAEPGVEQTLDFFANADEGVAVSAISLVEVYARLRALGRESHWPEVWDKYSLLFTAVIPADETIAHQAIGLRAAAAQRLPTIDSLIAATAVYHGLTLVHRDPHFAAIPAHILTQITLPQAD